MRGRQRISPGPTGGHQSAGIVPVTDKRGVSDSPHPFPLQPARGGGGGKLSCHIECYCPDGGSWAFENRDTLQ